MNLSSTQAARRLTLVGSALLLAMTVGYSTFSIVRSMRETAQPRATVPAPERVELPTNTAAQEPSVPLEVVSSNSEVSTSIAEEFETMRQKEQAHKDLIENLRKQARENPDDPGILSKERIDALEKSGDSLM